MDNDETGFAGQFEMYKFKFSKVDLKDLKKKADIIASELAGSQTEIEKFVRDPLTYIERFNIKILKEIEGTVFSRDEINNGLKEVLESGNKPVFTTCLGCKLAVLLLLYAVLAKLGVAELPASLEILNQFVEFLKNIFEGANEKINSLVGDLAKVVNSFSPWKIALLVCKKLGACG